MTDSLKVKASKAADDANVAAHEAYDDADVLVHNALKGAGVDVEKVSDDVKIGVHKVVSDAKIAEHKAGSELKKKQGGEDSGFNLARGNIPYSRIGVLHIWCKRDRRLFYGNSENPRDNLRNNCGHYLPAWCPVITFFSRFYSAG